MLLDWTSIDTVLLDMDGTLLDLHFDNYFWQIHLTQRYAQYYGLTEQVAAEKLRLEFARVEGTQNWYCLDYWQNKLGLNIIGLKREVAHLIAPHPHAEAFLENARRHKRLILVTNAHRDSLELKLAHTDIGKYFDAIISAHDFQQPKEAFAFWEQLQKNLAFLPTRTLLVEDNLTILKMAQSFGIRHLVAINHPDSHAPVKHITEFPAVKDFSALIPVH